MARMNTDLDKESSVLNANGAQDENRTHDLRITSALLYRLSYLGKTFILAPERRSALGGRGLLGDFYGCGG